MTGVLLSTLGVSRHILIMMAITMAAACDGNAGSAENRNDAVASTTDPAADTSDDSKPPVDREATSNTPDQQEKGDAMFARLLKVAVTETGHVRYDVLGQEANDKALNDVVDLYASAPLPSDRNRRLALWCNAYNANVLREALRERSRPGFVNVLQVEGFFDERSIMVAGERMTINGLENDRIRPLGDPRIHAVLVCAAMSCPPLRNEPYLAGSIDRQFDAQSAAWINDAAKNTADGARLQISSIFDWYGKDFDAEPYGGVRGFLAKYAKPRSPIATLLKQNAVAPIAFRQYDWTLNQAAARAALPPGF